MVRLDQPRSSVIEADVVIGRAVRGGARGRRLDSPGRLGQGAQPAQEPWQEPPELVSTAEQRFGRGSGVGLCCIVHPNKFDHYSMRFIVAGPSNGRVGGVCSPWRWASVAPADAPPAPRRRWEATRGRMVVGSLRRDHFFW